MKRWQIVLVGILVVIAFMRLQKPKANKHEECCGMKPPI